VQYTYEQDLQDAHLYPSCVSVILSSTYFEQTSSSSGGYFCTHSIWHVPCWNYVKYYV